MPRQCGGGTNAIITEIENTPSEKKRAYTERLRHHYSRAPEDECNVDKQTLSEKWRSINQNPQEEEHQWITIYHRTTGMPLLYVEGATLAGVDLEGANLIDADLRSRFEYILLHFPKILAPVIITFLPSHLPKLLQNILVIMALGYIASLLGGSKHSYLTQVDLRGANLRNALLIGADLRCADLRGADLRGTNLFSAQLWGTYLKGCIFDETTTWPAGFRPPRRKRVMPAVTPEADGELTPVGMQ